MATLKKGIDPLIIRLIGVYYALGIWGNGDGSKIRDIIRISVFVFCTFSYPLALAGGGLVSEVLGDSIFLLTLGLTVAVLEFKGVWVFFNQDKILNLLNATCVHLPNDQKLADRINRKLNILQKCSAIFVFLTMFLAFTITIVSSPLLFQPLPYKIWFPLDYKTSRAAHWTAHCFILISEVYLILLSFLSSIMWYVMLNCSIQYDMLGHRFKSLGGVAFESDRPTISRGTNVRYQNSFESELINCIQFHKQLVNNVNTVGSFFSALFFVQIGASAFCICGSVYILAVDSSSGLSSVCIGLLYYATVDIFTVMFIGNEIKVSSTTLLYCLFESNWIGQTVTCKRMIIMLAEVLKRHKVIMVAKLYPLSLETFNTIMRLAYSMFNILNSM